MANSDLPRGFRPYGRLLHVGIYVAQTTIYPGDAVKKHAGVASTAQGPYYRAAVTVAAAADPLIGVALNYAVAGDVVRVADDPSQLFVGQMDEAEFDSNVDLGLNCSILATAGSSTYKQSRMEIDSSTQATTQALELTILGYVPRQDGKNAMGANVEAIFKINNHQLGSVGTVGV